MRRWLFVLLIPVLMISVASAQTSTYVIIQSDTNLHDRPDAASPEAGQLYAGEALPILGLNADRTWVQVQAWYSYSSFWVDLSVAEVVGDLSDVPVVSVPTPMPTPSSATPTPSPSIDEPYIVATTGINVRSGPGIQGYQPIGALAAGERVPVIGINQAGDWLQIEYHGGSGWVMRALVEVNGSLANMPILDVPTPIATSTPMATPTPIIAPSATPTLPPTPTSGTRFRVRLVPDLPPGAWNYFTLQEAASIVTQRLDVWPNADDVEVTLDGADAIVITFESTDPALVLPLMTDIGQFEIVNFSDLDLSLASRYLNRDIVTTHRESYREGGLLYAQATIIPTHTPSPAPQVVPGSFNPVTARPFETVAFAQWGVQANVLGGSEQESLPAGLEIFTERMDWLSARTAWNYLIGIVVDGRVIGILFLEASQNSLRIYNTMWINESCEAAVFAVLLNHQRLPFRLQIAEIREVN
jgi:uncharacterized protein YraI